jgi:hypothetical protein
MGKMTTDSTYEWRKIGEQVKIVTDCWCRTLWGYREIDFQFEMTSGWIKYITKFATKDSDYIDWQNHHRDC